MLTSCAGFRNATDGTTTAATSAPATESSAPDTTAPVESNADTEPAETQPPETEANTAPVTEGATESATETEDSVKVDVPVGSFEPEALMYHLILEEVYSVYEALFVRPSEFEAHLTLLNDLGYEYLFAEEWRITETPSVIITLDDGYKDNYTNMFPILKAHGAKATIFLVSNLVNTDGYLTSAQIKEMSDSGLVSFQCHTANHVDLAHMSEDGVRSEFTESVSFIEAITGKPVRALAYPAGSYNDTVLSVVPEFFDYCYTTKSPNTIREYTSYTIPRHYIARGYGRAALYNFVKY